MKVYYDLHIHTVLSSCGDIMQTPNNILNMVMLKELGMISICDHNTGKQYSAIDKIKDSYDFLIIYGIEITTHEGFHLLAYFEKYEELMELDKIIDDSLDKSILPPDDQIIMDEYDMEVRKIPYFINQKVPFSFDELIKIIRKLNGIIIPAHINRKKTGILDYISDFSSYDIDAIEIYDGSDVNELLDNYPYLKKYRYLINSDAHDIDVIHEKEYYMELDDLSFASFKKYILGK